MQCSKGVRPTHIRAFLRCDLSVERKANRWAIPAVLHLPRGGLSTLHNPQQRQAPSFGSERCLCGITGAVPLPQQGKLLLPLIPAGYNSGDNEDQTGSDRLAGKHMWGLLSRQRFSTSSLKNYPQEGLPCQGLPNTFFCQNNPGLQWSRKNTLGLKIPLNLRDFPMWLKSVQT